MGSVVGNFYIGYSLGNVGIILTLAAADLSLTTFWASTIGSASLFGVILGGLCIGKMADTFGRRKLFWPSAFLVLILSCAQALAQSPQMLAFYRLLLGICLGAEMTLCTIMTSEWTCVKKQGKALSTLMVVWVIGYLASYCIGCIFAEIFPEAWRFLLASTVFPAVLAIWLRFPVPESPLWLADRGKQKEALQILSQYKHDGLSIRYSVSEKTQKSAWSELFKNNLFKHTIAGGIFYAGEVIPYYALGTFLPLLLNTLSINNPIVSGLFFYGALFFGILVGKWLVTRIQRRTFLVGSFLLCGLALSLMTFSINSDPILALVFLSVFSLVLSAQSVLVFVYVPELFPVSHRGSGVGTVYAFGNFFSASATFLLPLVMSALGVSAVLIICCAVLFFSGYVCYMLAPETFPIYTQNIVEKLCPRE